MKKGITIISILVAIGAALVFWFGGFTSGKGETETRWKGEPLEVGKVAPRLPEWRVLVIWEQEKEFSRTNDNHLALPYVVAQKEPPTLENINVPAPPLGATRWKAVLLYSVELLREGDPEPEPTKPEKPTK